MNPLSYVLRCTPNIAHRARRTHHLAHPVAHHVRPAHRIARAIGQSCTWVPVAAGLIGGAVAPSAAVPGDLRGEVAPVGESVDGAVLAGGFGPGGMFSPGGPLVPDTPLALVAQPPVVFAVDVPPATQVPEPGSVAVLLAGLASLLVVRRWV